MNTGPNLKTFKPAHIFGPVDTMALVFVLLACALPLGGILGVTGLVDAGTFLQTVAAVVVVLVVSIWIRSLLSGRGIQHTVEKAAIELAPETIIASIHRSNERNPDYLEQLAQCCARGEHLQNSLDYAQYLMNKDSLVRGNNRALCQLAP